MRHRVTAPRRRRITMHESAACGDKQRQAAGSNTRAHVTLTVEPASTSVAATPTKRPPSSSPEPRPASTVVDRGTPGVVSAKEVSDFLAKWTHSPAPAPPLPASSCPLLSPPPPFLAALSHLSSPATTIVSQPPPPSPSQSVQSVKTEKAEGDSSSPPASPSATAHFVRRSTRPVQPVAPPPPPPPAAAAAAAAAAPPQSPKPQPAVRRQPQVRWASVNRIPQRVSGKEKPKSQGVEERGWRPIARSRRIRLGDIAPADPRAKLER